MNRRGFLTGALGFLAAPAIVRATSLMPIKASPMLVNIPPYTFSFGEPRYAWFWFEGQTPLDDWSVAAAQDYMNKISRSLYGDQTEIGASVKAAFAS